MSRLTNDQLRVLLNKKVKYRTWPRIVCVYQQCRWLPEASKLKPTLALKITHKDWEVTNVQSFWFADMIMNCCRKWKMFSFMHILYITYQYLICISYFIYGNGGGTPHRLRVIDGLSRSECLAQFQTEPDIVFLALFWNKKEKCTVKTLPVAQWTHPWVDRYAPKNTTCMFTNRCRNVLRQKCGKTLRG